MDTTADQAALPYHEPGIVIILIASAFVLLLNITNHVVDKILYCGLLAQIFLGIAWGTPGGDWLGREFEHSIVNLGYLGLLLIVYEGGLSTSFRALKDNLLLSIGVALIGIVLPIGASYVLLSLVGATPLQGFAAGAALCSTSLGTTFTVLAASNLTSTRLGTVLTSAAMMDDVVGLVMVQVISNLGPASSGFSATDVVRPVLVSLAFVIVVPLLAYFTARPLTLWLNQRRTTIPNGRIDKYLSVTALPVIVHTLILLGLITGAVNAGTSGLFAAYLAGASITWWDNEVPHVEERRLAVARSDGTQSSERAAESKPCTGVQTFEMYYAPTLQRLLKPFFFASIGFSVPVTRMFSCEVVWKGMIYTVLMFISKFACGFWLMRIPGLATRIRLKLSSMRVTEKSTAPEHDMKSSNSKTDTTGTNTHGDASPETRVRAEVPPQSNEARPITKRSKQSAEKSSPKPISLYPGCILGAAMVARGEIGFLISAIAESNGIFGEEPNGPIFLVVTWAIMLCTILGPLLVGTLVRRVKRLERQAGGRAGNVLGVWALG